ncbi:MAG: hypothetical protein KME35_05835 [Aphanocapsa sp. GSE-SYN-MK-11-07L]|jgi:hypothetical protein|nr:hypothetical protein [Aphanocapsa sp. GSE-SYN-MK-11-07L]
MNRKLIVFSGVITAAIGAVIGLSASELARPKFESSIYQNLAPKYAAAGGVIGLLAGAGQEAIRQLKQQREKEEDTN